MDQHLIIKVNHQEMHFGISELLINKKIATGLYIYHIEKTGMVNINPRFGKFAVIR